MKTFAVSLLCFGLVALAAVAGDQKAAKIDGTWVATTIINKGKKLSNEGLTKLNLAVVIMDGTYSISVQNDEVETGTYKTDAAKKPATFDVVVKTGEHKGKTQLGIYKLGPDRLTLVVDEAGSSRPKTFDDADAEITVLKRMK